MRRATLAVSLALASLAADIRGEESAFPTDPRHVFGSVAPALAADADEPRPGSDALLERIEELEAAEAKRRAAEQRKADQERKNSAEEGDKKTGPSKVSGGQWNVRLGGHVQLDYINWADSSVAIPDTQDYFEFRRLRLVAEGTGYEVYDFRLQMTLEPESVGENPPGTTTSPEIKDAYFSINEVPLLGRVRIGHFFVPFGLEQVTNDTNNIFLERSIPTQGVFTGDREVGLAIYNRTQDQSVTWASGVFFDNISDGIKERIDNNQGYRASGRITWVPYYDERSKGRYLIHTGAGILYTEDHDDRVRFRARPQIHEGPRIIDSGVLAADAYTTGNVEFAIVWGPVTLQSEAYLSSVNMLAGDSETFHGGYAHVSWFLTGENRVYERFGQHGAQFGRNAPARNVIVTSRVCSCGAWELKARYSHLNLTSVGRGEYNDATVGVNWYWSDRVRVMFDWIHPLTTEGAVFGKTESDILASRFDFNW
jgi:phosphate-selective porin OprO and OprP